MILLWKCPIFPGWNGRNVKELNKHVISYELILVTVFYTLVYLFCFHIPIACYQTPPFPKTLVEQSSLNEWLFIIMTVGSCQPGILDKNIRAEMHNTVVENTVTKWNYCENWLSNTILFRVRDASVFAAFFVEKKLRVRIHPFFATIANPGVILFPVRCIRTMKCASNSCNS